MTSLICKYTSNTIDAKPTSFKGFHDTRVFQKLHRFLLTGQKEKLYSNEIYVISIPYLSSINSETFMYLAWICVELWLIIQNTHYRRPGPGQWRHVQFAFHSVTISLMFSQITRSLVKETDDGVSITARLFILNIKVKQTTPICCADSISRRDIVPTLLINIYHSEHCKVINPNPCLHVFYRTQNSLDWYSVSNSHIIPFLS